MKRIAIASSLVAALLLSTPGMALADGSSIPVKVMDVIFIRPVTAVGAIMTTGMCAVAMPFALAAGGSAEDLVDEMVTRPWRYTATRPLGDFSD